MYDLNYSAKFKRKLKKLIRKNQFFQVKVRKVLSLMKTNPFLASLKSHKVNTEKGESFSSLVTGDIRIIWKFNREEAEIVDITDIGGHSGKDKVYK